MFNPRSFRNLIRCLKCRDCLGRFYDDLGNIAAQPHLVLGPGPEADPSFYVSALSSSQEPYNSTEVCLFAWFGCYQPFAFQAGTLRPVSWLDWAETFYDS